MGNEHAVKTLNHAEPDRIARQRDRLLELLDNESDWLQAETIITLCKIATHRDHYQKVLPVIIDKAAAIRVASRCLKFPLRIPRRYQAERPVPAWKWFRRAGFRK